MNLNVLYGLVILLEQRLRFKTQYQDCLLALHHSLLIFGNSVRALGIKAKKPIKVGPVNTGSVAYPLVHNLANEAAAYRATFNVFGSEEDNIPIITGTVQLILFGISPGILTRYFWGFTQRKD